jgi:hypothetical protein
MGRRAIRRALVALGIGTLIFAGLSTFLGVQAQAYVSQSVTLPGSLYLGNSPVSSTPIANNAYSESLTLGQTPTSPNVGDQVNVTLSGTNGFPTGPVATQANSIVVRSTLTLSGQMQGEIQLSSNGQGQVCDYPVTGIGSFNTTGSWVTTGQFTVLSPGLTAVSLKQIFFDDQGNFDQFVHGHLDQC